MPVLPTPPPLLAPGALTAVPHVLAISAVVLSVAAEDAGDTAVGVGALELTGQADVPGSTSTTMLQMQIILC